MIEASREEFKEIQRSRKLEIKSRISASTYSNATKDEVEIFMQTESQFNSAGIDFCDEVNDIEEFDIS